MATQKEVSEGAEVVQNPDDELTVDSMLDGLDSMRD